MKPSTFHSKARRELDEAVAFYEERRAGLGLDFLAEVEAAVERVCHNPKLHEKYKQTDYRRCVLSRFPYTVFYLELEDSVWVAAVAHAKRRPGYWMRRKPE